MTELDDRCLDAFPNWLRTLGDDARVLASLVEANATSDGVRRQLTAALNYLFKSLDLIPDGIEDLGFIDDAFVFRVAASFAVAEGGSHEALTRLKAEAALVQEFLGADYPRLERYVRGLATATVRGRSVDEIAKDPAVRAELVRELRGWADSYGAPTFARDVKNLVKLRSFLGTKLPS